MEIAINEAKGKLSGLIKAAQKGEHVVLTKHGHPVAEIRPLAKSNSSAEKLALLRKIAARTAKKVNAGPDAAHAADFLYDDDGTPS